MTERLKSVDLDSVMLLGSEMCSGIAEIDRAGLATVGRMAAHVMLVHRAYVNECKRNGEPVPCTVQDLIAIVRGGLV